MDNESSHQLTMKLNSVFDKHIKVMQINNACHSSIFHIMLEIIHAQGAYIISKIDKDIYDE